MLVCGLQRLKERLFQKAARFLVGLQKPLDAGAEHGILAARTREVGGALARRLLVNGRLKDFIRSHCACSLGAFAPILQCDGIAPRAPGASKKVMRVRPGG